MDKKLVVGLVIVVVAIAIAGFFLLPRLQPSGDEGDGKFTLSIEPTQVTMEVGESKNFTLTVISTGYEGNITDSGPTYGWIGEEPPLIITGEFLPLSDEPGARFLQAKGNLTLTLRVTCARARETLSNPANVTLSTGAYGNWKQPDEFRVSSNAITMTITP